MNSPELIQKQKAKKIIESLLENSYISYIKSNKIIYTCINGVLNFFLSQCLIALEDLNCEAILVKSLDYFNTLPISVKVRYINYCQEIYNNLGILFYNKGEVKKGLQYLGKAEQMYFVFNDIKGYNLTNDFDEFMLACTKQNEESSNLESSSLKSLKYFNFYIDGGINNYALEMNYTNTIFYYAQAFTKLNFRSKGIYYCSHTLKHQIEFNNFDLKDSIINCITLSDYFLENSNFAQAEYFLLSGLALLPVDITKKKNLRAQVHQQLGKCYAERLKFAKNQTKEQIWISESAELSQTVNKKVCIFSSLNVGWPKIEDIKDKEQAIELFRLANTQFKRGLEYFVLDGYVTENIQINRFISSLYKNLSFFEDVDSRIFGMLERRISLLKPLYEAINEKVFVVQMARTRIRTSRNKRGIFRKKLRFFA